MSGITEHRLSQLETRTTTLESQILQALVELAQAVGSVRVVTERLVSFEQRFAEHDAAENEDRKALTAALDKLSETVKPLVEERRAVAVLANGIVRASAVIAAAIGLVGFGPRAWAWLAGLW